LGTKAAAIKRPFQFFLQAPKADPVAIVLGYGEEASFEVGIMNLSTGDFEYWDKPGLFNARYINFEVVEYPGGNNQETWTVQFNPYTLEVKRKMFLKSNVTLSLRSPPVLENAIQSGVLKLRMHDTWANGDMWRIPEGIPASTLRRIIWFIYAWPFQMGYGPFSGTVDIRTFDVDILVKVKPYHAVKMKSIPYMEFNPNTITSIPITLQNLGNYNDTYSFRVNSDSKDIKISDPISITLAPGEIKDTYLGVSIPPNIFDFGTIHEVKIEAYSIDQPNITIAERTVLFETKGLHITEMGALGVMFLIFIIFLVVGLLLYKQKLLYEKYSVKPDKPWEIPEEKSYLEKLKEKDRDKYKEVLNIMEDEYNSALLWHKYYCESQIKSEQRKKEKARTEEIRKLISRREKARKEKLKLKQEKQEKIKAEKEKIKVEKEKREKPKKKEEKKPKKPIPIEEEEVKPEEPKKVVKEELVVDKEAEADKLRRERALLRIRQEQERQRKKFSGSSYGKGD
jgi:hypothetical protein